MITISRRTIAFKDTPVSLHWRGNDLIDWVYGGRIYTLDGSIGNIRVHYGYKFDAAIQSEDGVYAVIYERLGTKGLVLNNNELVREINRSYYCAEAYEYPVAFLKLHGGNWGIVHCPGDYNQLEIESIEGERIASLKNRAPSDIFHSRLRVNPDHTILLSSGWVWHPYGTMEWYDLTKALRDVSVLDMISPEFLFRTEVASAEFLNADLVVVSTSDETLFEDTDINHSIHLTPRQIGLYSVSGNRILKKVTLERSLGTLIPINEDVVIDLYEFPKLIDLNTGRILQQFPDIYSGKRNLAILDAAELIPPIAVDRANGRIAIGKSNGIELLEIN